MRFLARSTGNTRGGLAPARLNANHTRLIVHDRQGPFQPTIRYHEQFPVLEGISNQGSWMEAPPGLNPDESVVKSTSLYRLNRLVRRPLTQPRWHTPPLQLTTLNKSLYRLISPYKETRCNTNPIPILAQPFAIALGTLEGGRWGSVEQVSTA
jgi:hypothetical protein